MSWKDEWRDEKDESGLTWDEFHRRQFVHESELNGMSDTLERLDDHVQALTDEYQELRRELQEVRMLYESDEFEP